MGWTTLLACAGPSGTLTVPVDSSAVPFDALAEEAGFVVQEGALVFMDEQDCCAPDANCIFNNPTTPYGSYRLPPAPDQEVPTPPAVPTHQVFLLRPDEAVVWMGVAPPPAKYFSFRTYLWNRPGDELPIFGSLGPTVNHASVASTLGRPAWDQPLAIVTTADAGVEDEVAALLADAGWDPAAVAFDRVPAGEASLGLKPGVAADSDEYAMIVRIAVDEDPERSDAWRAAPGRVLRLSPREPRPAGALHPADPLAPPGRGEPEPLGDALLSLERAVHRAYPGFFRLVRVSEDRPMETLGCLTSEPSCLGESVDANYRALPQTGLLPGQFLVVYGVNHERTGRASYASFAIEQQDNKFGIAAVESDDFVGSAAPFVDDGFRAEQPATDPDDLWAWVLARDCADPIHAGRRCTEIPETCPGVALDDTLFVRFRAYLDPVTGARPSPSEITPARGTLFFRAP
jgi:hypothetical protein